VGIFSIALARIFFGANSSHDMQRLGVGFFLHDLGKCKLPLEILNKPGALTPEERQVVNRHPEDGSTLLRESGYATEEAEIIILQHHERDNGTGYPNGLKGSEIHPYARICRLADVYDALTSERPYHKKRTTFEALKMIKEEMVDLDQDLINCFIKLFV
jgi:HD-GYP domain-containing protein (c-di-GMP phosphodiesterase class II)